MNMIDNGATLSPITVLIVDDHPVICHGLKRVLEKQNDIAIIGEAGDWQSAMTVVEEQRPDIVVVDITLRGIDGISLVNRIKESGVDSRIIMYTMHSSRDYVSRAFHAGALGYVLKSDKTEQLVAAIREVLKGRIYLSESLSVNILTDLLGGRSISEVTGTGALSPREYEVASLIAQGNTLDQIGEMLFISPQTVRVHRTKIMHKLACHGVHELLLKLRQYFPQ